MPSLSGRINFHDNFFAQAPYNRRTIAVYLPPSYDMGNDKRYPVLYMHDGQNIYDGDRSHSRVGWNIDQTLERLIIHKRIAEIIVVGIYNTSDRINEYTPYIDSVYGGGKAEQYVDFILNYLKPFIDHTYRTLRDGKYTSIMGSSLGGLISLFMAWNYPQIFSMVGVISPVLSWCNYKIINEIEKSSKEKNIKIYLDIGLKETNTLHDTRKLRDVLFGKNFTIHENIEYFEDEEGIHHETSWAKRVYKPLLFFFGHDNNYSTS